MATKAEAMATRATARTAPRTAARKTVTRLPTSVSQTSQIPVRRRLLRERTLSRILRLKDSRTKVRSHRDSRDNRIRVSSHSRATTSAATIITTSVAITTITLSSAQEPRTMYAQAAMAVAEA